MLFLLRLSSTVIDKIDKQHVNGSPVKLDIKPFVHHLHAPQQPAVIAHPPPALQSAVIAHPPPTLQVPFLGPYVT